MMGAIEVLKAFRRANIGVSDTPVHNGNPEIAVVVDLPTLSKSDPRRQISEIVLNAKWVC